MQAPSPSSPPRAVWPRALALTLLVGLACGVSSGVFLMALDAVTQARLRHPALVWGLPLAGVLLGAFYDRWGARVQGGTNVVLDHLSTAGSPGIAARMAPMVLLGTLVTHLFGGSAGREGTAVQIGASLGDNLARRLGADPSLARRMTLAGVAGGFGAVFGTPFAGALFAIEFGVVGALEVRAAPWLLASALVGDRVTRAMGVRHTAFPPVQGAALGPSLALRWLVFAAAVALLVRLFHALTDGIKHQLAARLSSRPARLALGGATVLLLTALVPDAGRYLGLGVSGIVAAFRAQDTAAWAPLAKLVFTAVTLGAGFIGGEVTPLFFMGACLGATLSGPLGLPPSLAAAVGLATTFGTAANAPIALTVMAVELYGPGVAPHALLVGAVAWALVGHRSLYSAQRWARDKRLARLEGRPSTRDLSDRAW